MTEVQSHGFYWQNDILMNVYGCTSEELEENKYNSKFDLEASKNHLDHCDLSVKTTCNQNAVCMADCLRVYDMVSSGKPIHMVVIYYIQKEDMKHVYSIVEVDLTNSCDLLFGHLTRIQIEELDQLVKSVPQKRKPTKEEYDKMYSLRDSFKTNAIHLDIKCNSTQSRLQCSFNRFQTFLEQYPLRIVSKSNTNEFRGGIISSQLKSYRRKFNIKTSV
jgi:hypothetical protein